MKTKLSDLCDFHAHILPGADHGSKSTAESLCQLALLADAGVSTVVASPHFYPNSDNVDAFLERRSASAEALLCALSGEENYAHPKIALGSEVLVCVGMENMPGLERLSVSGTRVILLEMPSCPWQDALADTLMRISESGLTPVLAHPGRYRFEEVDRLLSALPLRLQLNAGESLRLAGKRNAERWISDGLVCAVGSDIHGADKKSARSFAAFFKKFSEGGDITQKTLKLLEDAVFLEKQPLRG